MIIDNYHNLPDKILFVHGQRMSWHQDYNIDFIINNLDWNFKDYLNINKREYYCIMDHNNWSIQFNWVLNNWNVFDKYFDKPDKLHFYACCQFLVDKKLILQHTEDFWCEMFEWLQNTDLDNDISGRIFEYMWHYIFTGKLVDDVIDNILIK